MSEIVQTDWVRWMLDTGVGVYVVFFVIPAGIGFATAWTVRNRGTQSLVAVALGAVAPPLVLALLSAVATIT